MYGQDTEIKCEACANLVETKYAWYCPILKCTLENGYAMRYYSQLCQADRLHKSNTNTRLNKILTIDRIIRLMLHGGSRFFAHITRPKCKRVGTHISIARGVTLTGTENIELGDYVNIMTRSYIYAHNGGFVRIGSQVGINTNVQIGAADNGEIIIGNDVLIASNVVIRASNHVYDRLDIPIREQGHSGGKIVINDDVWIGANVTILPNVTIGRGAVIGAGAVVTKDIPPYAVAMGIPATVQRYRYDINQPVVGRDFENKLKGGET